MLVVIFLFEKPKPGLLLFYGPYHAMTIDWNKFGRSSLAGCVKPSVCEVRMPVGHLSVLAGYRLASFVLVSVCIACVLSVAAGFI